MKHWCASEAVILVLSGEAESRFLRLAASSHNATKEPSAGSDSGRQQVIDLVSRLFLWTWLLLGRLCRLAGTRQALTSSAPTSACARLSLSHPASDCCCATAILRGSQPHLWSGGDLGPRQEMMRAIVRGTVGGGRGQPCEFDLRRYAGRDRNSRRV